VLGLERLNYGLWEPDEDLTLENLKRAQQRYEDHIVGLIPGGVRRVLDVGCGTGVMSARLRREGYDVEGLSPDRAQQAAFTARTAAPFHLTRFQDLEAGEPFDCLIMSESVQYVPLERVFPKVAECLVDRGWLIVCDYFTLPGASGIQAKSGHDLADFRAHAAKGGFVTIAERDITEQAVRTLDLAADFAARAEIGVELATQRFRDEKPLRYRLGKWLLRKPIRKMTSQRPLIDSDAFRESKRYLSFVFQRGGAPIGA
jgi:MPBQ/MSBQ methyltransferase